VTTAHTILQTHQESRRVVQHISQINTKQACYVHNGHIWQKVRGFYYNHGANYGIRANGDKMVYCLVIKNAFSAVQIIQHQVEEEVLKMNCKACGSTQQWPISRYYYCWKE